MIVYFVFHIIDYVILYMTCDDKYNLIIENAKIRKKLNELGICGITGPTGPAGAGVKNITEFHNVGYRGLYNVMILRKEKTTL